MLAIGLFYLCPVMRVWALGFGVLNVTLNKENEQLSHACHISASRWATKVKVWLGFADREYHWRTQLKKICNLILLSMLTACSANQIKLQSQLLPSINTSLFELKESVTIKAYKAQSSVLNAGTTWFEVGSIDQGVVYRTKDQVVIVNSFDVHEGYIVVKESTVVGYYLPVEKTFVESEPEPINLSEME